MNAVLLKPGPFPEPDRLVLLTVAANDRPLEPVLSVTSPERYGYWRSQTDVLEDASAYRRLSLNLSAGDVLERVSALQVTSSYFRTFRAQLERGRPFSSGEDAPGAEKTVVVGHDFWARRLAASPAAIGATLLLGGVPHTIVGILAADFGGADWRDVDVWVPLQLDPAATDRNEYLQVAARLKDGVSLAQAQQRLEASAAAYRERAPAAMRDGYTFTAIPFQDTGIGSQTRLALWLLLGMVGLLLLIACANLANLMLVRALARGREMAIRAALGAGHWRVIRQLLTESAMLATAGCALGTVLGLVGIRALLAVDTAGLPRVGAGGTLLGLDWRVGAFALGMAVITCVLFGLAPALHAARGDLTSVMKQSGHRTANSRRQNRLISTIVVAEVGIAVVLLTGAGLLIRTSLALNRVDTGFAVDNVLVIRTSLAEPRFASAAAVHALTTRTLERLLEIPGVATAAAACCVPLQRSFGDVFNVVGRDNGANRVSGGGDIAIGTGSYFDTFEIPLRSGRVFDERDVAGAPPVVVINRTMAERFWRDGADPLTSQLVIGGHGAPRQVIGVVEDVRALALTSRPRPIMYLPLAQIPDAELAFDLGNEPLAWIVRTTGDPTALASSVQAEVGAATRTPIADVKTMREILSASISRQRFNTLLMTLFGATALLLASVGIYGLIAFAVQQRTHEIGIRLALGARVSQVRAMVLGRGATLAAIGTATGLVTSFLSSRLLAPLLYGIGPHDAAVFIAVATLLAGVVFVASFIPAQRASRVRPSMALRDD